MSGQGLPYDPEFARDVRQGLNAEAKHLPPRWLYDERGSQLFEEITKLPEYYLTRIERAILEANATEIISRCGTPLEAVELGAGSAAKTRHLLQAALDRDGSATYCPVDISQAAIEMAREELQGCISRGLTIRPVVGSYQEGLEKLKGARTGPRLLLFIGSTLGNYAWERQGTGMAYMADALSTEDRFLVGTDMHKDPERLVAAYDDAQGVTERFSLNLLARINRELGGTFDLEAFAHRARYNEDEHRIEVHLESLEPQKVRIDALDLEVDFAQGELVHTEYAYKYTEAMIDTLVDGAGLERERSWYDDRGWFGVHLLRLRRP